MHRTFVILRHTFFESVVQPIYALLLGLGVAVLGLFAFLPFFTLGEDTVMFKAVGLDIILLLVLIATLFAASRSIYEEIEDRTMLTLMSKPVSRWEVLLGKYLGIVAAALLAVAVLGAVLAAATWFRVPNDGQLNANAIDPTELKQIADTRAMYLAGLYPSLVLVWLQVSVLAAVGVAISTRFSLVVNLPTVLLIYLAGNLTRFLAPAVAGGGVAAKVGAFAVGLVLPFLQTFDLTDWTVYSTIKLAGTRFADTAGGVTLAAIWGYVGVATLYALAYATVALAAGMLLFQSRELGGAEG